MKYILLLVCSFILFDESLCMKGAIQPILTLDKTQKFGASNDSDTCFLTPPECDPTYKYRSYNGSCNNLNHPTWGALHTAFTRLFPPRYSDGVELPPKASDGSELPNARLLTSSFFHDQDVPDNVSLIVAQFAQFVAHDFGVGVPKTGVDDCCASDDPLVCLSIRIPENDPFYSQFGTNCLRMTRTQTTLTGNCDSGPKQQINGVTHGLDGSQIYGSDESKAHSLREHEGGRMIVREGPGGRYFLPTNGTCYKSDVCYAAGEARVNQNTQLTVLHTMYVRGHNNIASALEAIHPDWDDEILYQEARRLIVAVYQHIIYNEFLPNILPHEEMQELGLISKTSGYHEYDDSIPYIVITSFSTPIFRVFHSGLQGIIAMYNYQLDPTKYINLTDYMNSPGILEEENNFDELILGFVTQPMQTIDTFYTSQIDGKLFHFDRPYGADLNTLDIQRSRDHGVPAYVTVLYACRGVEVKTFDDLSNIWPEENITKARQFYKAVEDVDLFVGGNFERKIQGHRFPPTFECVISEQFYRWKNGDRFWYEVSGQPHSFSPDQLNEIRKITLSRVICDTSDNIVNITANAFAPPSEDNPIVPCAQLPTIDFSKWA